MARIGIDLDGVCYDFTQAFCDYVGKPNTATTWEFYRDWGWSTDVFLSKCRAAIKCRALFRNGHLIDGAQEGLQALRRDRHEIFYVTDRFSLDPDDTEKIRAYTLDWIAKNDLPMDGIKFTADKAEAVTRLGLDYFLDDKIENYEAVFQHTDALLFDQPWNAKAHHAARVRSWDEFLTRVRKDTLTKASEKIEWKLAPAEARVIMTKDEILEEVRVTSNTGGQKGQKLARLGSLDPQALLEVAKVAGFGEAKYDRLNYMKGYDWNLTFDAGMRHRLAFWNGEDVDPESGLPHLAHAAWHDLCLLAFYLRGLGRDNRYTTEVDCNERSGS